MTERFYRERCPHCRRSLATSLNPCPSCDQPASIVRDPASPRTLRGHRAAMVILVAMVLANFVLVILSLASGTGST
jgi:hypothetical protein